MRVRKAVGAALGAVGATALANRALTRSAGDLEPALSGDHNTYRWRGFDVAYTTLGDPDDEDLVAIHGINASGSSHEFRHVAEDLADEYHVIVPDLPGFGRSDRPPLVYSGSLYTAFVTDFLEDVADEPVVIGSSLGGGYAAAAADRVAVSELVLVCPTAETMPGRRTWLRSLVRSPVVGTGLFNLATCKPAIRYFNADHGYYDEANVTEDLVDYQWTTAHQQGARFAPASFFAGFLDPDLDLAGTLADLEVPMTLIWGRQATVSPLSEGEELAEAADVRLVVFDESDVQPHVEHPRQFVSQVVRGETLDDPVDIEIDDDAGPDED